MPDDTQIPPRILQLVTQDKLGGVRTLVEMVEAGLKDSGYSVETRGLRTADRSKTVGNMLSLARDIMKGRYQAVLTYQAAASVYGSFFAWLGGIPLRVSHHTASPEGIRAHWKAIDWLFGCVGIHTHMVINSQATRAAYGRWPAIYRRRFIDIIHGVDPLPAPRGRIDWRQRLQIPATATVLVATGRLVAQKNHGILVDTLALLSGVHLIIAGDGPDQAELEDHARRLGVADRLHLIGPIERSALGDVLAAGTLYVFPSVWETFGLAGVEATMAGLPIVASDLPVLREVLSTGASSDIAAMVRFHPVRDADALALAVQELVAAYPSDDLRLRFAEGQRLRHSRERMLDLYRTLLGPLKA